MPQNDWDVQQYFPEEKAATAGICILAKYLNTLLLTSWLR
jgi:hypothetical protein